MKKMVLSGTATFVLTLVGCVAADVFFILSTGLALNGYMGNSDIFLYWIIGILLKSVAVSLAGLWTAAILSRKPIFISAAASILLVPLIALAFSMLNLVIDAVSAFGLLIMLDIQHSNRQIR